MKRLFLFSAIIYLAISSVMAQNKKAERYFDEALLKYRSSDYKEALLLAKKACEKDPYHIDSWLLQAETYNRCDSTLMQIKTLEHAISIGAGKEQAKAYYILANAYYDIGEYEKSLNTCRSFLSSGNTGSLGDKANKIIERNTVALQLKKNPVEFEPKRLNENINSNMDEYWPSITIDGKTIVFTRLIGKSTNSFLMSPQFQEDFYEAKLNDENEWQKAQPMRDVNTLDNEGAQSISASGKLLFFTACNRADGYGSCDIYFSRKINNEWTIPVNAGKPINSSAWESQPSISGNEQYLFFVSQREGGKGGKDIWKCKLKGFDVHGLPMWGEPENLGDAINTKGAEQSPFIHPDGQTLYFASDTWDGLGQDDIFISRMKADSTWTKAKNIGFPINSHLNEQGFVVDASAKNAYYASNRPGSEGLDIYTFELHKDAQPLAVSYIDGVVVDKETGKPLVADIKLVNLSSNLTVLEKETDASDGKFLVCLPTGSNYAFSVSKDGYLFYSDHFALKEEHKAKDPYKLYVELQLIDIGKKEILRNIFFDYDSYDLKKQSIIDLNKLWEFMQLNPQVSVEIGGHTDHNGSDEYNAVLSTNRAKAVYDYLAKEGIDTNRMSYKGYGKTLPIATNSTNEGQALNRRTEFKIIGL